MEVVMRMAIKRSGGQLVIEARKVVERNRML